MENFGDLLGQMLDNTEGPNAFDAIMGDPAISFGPRDEPYVLAELLPDRTVDNNVIEAQAALRFDSVIANATDRFSTPQYKGAVEGVSMGAKLADSNAGFKVEAPQVEAFNRMLRRGESVQAMAQTLRAFERGTVKPLLDLAELWRSQMIVSAQVTAVGMNGRAEIIPYTNPTNSRSAAGGQWSDNAYDPLPDILAKMAWLKANGYRVGRIIADDETIRILQGNAKMRDRGIAIRVVETANVNGTVLTGMPTGGRLSMAQLNAVLAEDGLPPITSYDAVYNTSTQKGVHFWPRRTMAFFGITAQGEDITDTSGQLIRTLTNTLGYTGIGVVVGETVPGRVYQNEYVAKKPPHATFTGWQTMLPVLEREDAIAVITGIT